MNRLTGNGAGPIPALATTFMLVLVAIVQGCSSPEGPAKPLDVAEVLAACPDDDRSWKAVVEAGSAEAAGAPTNLERELSGGACAGHWGASWTLGELALRRDEVDVARGRYVIGIENARREGSDVGVAKCALGLGWVSYLTGDLDAAREAYGHAIEAARSVGRIDLVAFARSDLAAALLEQGEFTAVLDQLDLAESALEEVEDHESARWLRYNRTVVLQELGDAAAVEESFSALRVEAARGGDSWLAGACAVGLGRLALARDDADTAREWFENVGDEEADLAVFAAIGLGRVALHQDRTTEARTALKHALGLAEASDRPAARTAEVFLAEAERLDGDIEVAERRVRRVIDEADEAEELANAWLARLTLGRVLAAEGRTSEAAAAYDAAVERVESAGSALDPSGEGLRFLRERTEPYVERALLAFDEPERVFALTRRAHARALRAAAGGTPMGEESTPAPGELALIYLLGERRSVLLAMTRAGARVHEIPGRRVLARQVASFRENISRRPDDPSDSGADAIRSGTALSQNLLGPVADLLRSSSRLHVTPDRDLALVPFIALPTPGDPEANPVGRSLAVGIRPLPGAIPEMPESPDRILLAGAPTAGASREADLPELPGTALELSRLRELYGSGQTVYLGGDRLRTSELLDALAGPYDVVHLATHAEASAVDPRRTGILLSHGERLGFDDVAKLDRVPPVVVLSACRTGEGEIVPGQGVLGMGWSFHHAGATVVVASHWRVDDATSSRLMVGFHRRLRDGAAPVDALAEATRELSRQHPHPRYWAAFVVSLAP